MTEIEGGCLCGQVRYRLLASPLSVVLCHCKNCQKSSGSAFSVNVMAGSGDLKVTGETTYYLDHAERGAEVRRCFCPKCGSVLMSVLEDEIGMTAIKAGTLDDPAIVDPKAQFWVRSAQTWLPPMPVDVTYERANSA